MHKWTNRGSLWKNGTTRAINKSPGLESEGIEVGKHRVRIGREVEGCASSERRGIGRDYSTMSKNRRSESR